MEAELRELEAELRELEMELRELEKEFRELEKELRELEKELRELEKELRELEKELRELEKELRELEKELRELEKRQLFLRFAGLHWVLKRRVARKREFFSLWWRGVCAGAATPCGEGGTEGAKSFAQGPGVVRSEPSKQKYNPIATRKSITPPVTHATL